MGSNPENEWGKYFAWGETEQKNRDSWKNYRHCKKGQNKLTKYCTQAKRGVVDSIIILDGDDDAARKHLGGEWRIPTREEFQELFDNCELDALYSSYWLYDGGTLYPKKSFRLTSTINGNSIILSSGGYSTINWAWFFVPCIINRGDSGYYWCSTLNSEDSRCGDSYHIYYPQNSNRVHYDYYSMKRNNGLTIRPVCNKKEIEKYLESIF